MASRVLPVARVLFLPEADPRGIGGISKIILVLRLGQPSLLAGSFASLPAIAFCTKALPRSTPIVRKEQLVAVQALTLIFRDLHSVSKSKAATVRGIRTGTEENPTEENSGRRRRKKKFQ